MTGSRLLATMLIGSGAALRMPLRPRMMCDSSFRSPMEPSTAGLNDAQKKILMDQMQQGVDSGGWDNDEYLEATKANKPVTSNKELLRQSEAYMDMLNAKMLRPSPEVVAEIERIKSAMTPEEMQEYEAERPRVWPPARRRRRSRRRRRRRPHRRLCSSSSRWRRRPRAPAPVNVNAGGVAAAASYASILASSAAPAPIAATGGCAAAAAGRAPRCPPPPPPVAGLATRAPAAGRAA